MVMQLICQTKTIPKLLKSKADTALKDKALANKKVEVLDTKKIGAFSKKYKEKIKKLPLIEILLPPKT